MIINKNHFCVCRCSSLLDVTWQYLNIYFLLIRPECDWAHEKWRGFIRQAMKQWTYSCRFKNHIIRKTNIHHLHINKDLALSYLTRFWFLLIAEQHLQTCFLLFIRVRIINMSINIAGLFYSNDISLRHRLNIMQTAAQ